MPQCEPWCPLVKAQLKKLAADSPWLFKKDAKTGTYHVGYERVDAASDPRRIPVHSQTTMVSQTRGHDKLLGTDAVEYSSRFVGDSTRIGRRDQETMREDSIDDVGTMFPDDCEPTCPRRISQRTRRRKLRERQRVVDAYLLNKGTHYFEDICTCCFSCLIRSLGDNPFVRSTLTSAVLFTFGLKLCSELDAWYLPIRLS